MLHSMKSSTRRQRSKSIHLESSTRRHEEQELYNMQSRSSVHPYLHGMYLNSGISCSSSCFSVSLFESKFEKLNLCMLRNIQMKGWVKFDLQVA